ncbi:MAG: hypothetical protein ABJR05_10780 [Balneola sp.]
MKFDLSSLIITVVALLAFIIPVTFDQINKRKTSNTLKKLSTFAEKEKLNLDKSDVYQHTYALGLDKRLKKIAYLNTNGNESVGSTYDLNQVSTCRFYQSDVTENGTDLRKISFIKLQFKDSKTEPVELEIYKMMKNLSYTEEESMAKKMVKSINSMLA